MSLPDLSWTVDGGVLDVVANRAAAPPLLARQVVRLDPKRVLQNVGTDTRGGLNNCGISFFGPYVVKCEFKHSLKDEAYYDRINTDLAGMFPVYYEWPDGVGRFLKTKNPEQFLVAMQKLDGTIVNLLEQLPSTGLLQEMQQKIDALAHRLLMKGFAFMDFVWLNVGFLGNPRAFRIVLMDPESGLRRLQSTPFEAGVRAFCTMEEGAPPRICTVVSVDCKGGTVAVREGDDILPVKRIPINAVHWYGTAEAAKEWLGPPTNTPPRHLFANMMANPITKWSIQDGVPFGARFKVELPIQIDERLAGVERAYAKYILQREFDGMPRGRYVGYNTHEYLMLRDPSNRMTSGRYKANIQILGSGLRLVVLDHDAFHMSDSLFQCGRTTTNPMCDRLFDAPERLFEYLLSRTDE